MDTSIPTPMSTFPMQYVGKLDVLGLELFFVYVGIRSGHTPWCEGCMKFAEKQCRPKSKGNIKDCMSLPSF